MLLKNNVLVFFYHYKLLMEINLSDEEDHKKKNARFDEILGLKDDGAP